MSFFFSLLPDTSGKCRLTGGGYPTKTIFYGVLLVENPPGCGNLLNSGVIGCPKELLSRASGDSAILVFWHEPFQSVAFGFR